ncbi:sulfite exporter TauE/SafE family protein [Anaerotalea alkaliphila]|uniref:Probable membrane transporter protein n=1 Tax=Anaerotalea alkaliphila TaxID=2662126 RepID=A0A7X5HUV4_9FIRM|nr:sulfite exporter TauE/SafE family protein [Anaerotalea alkaliphila]NDL67015.1 sulfite exporter TauE/SafE family protein [Anaerotalea alkaliphila]
MFYIIVFLTNIIQAITGFAGTMLAMPASMLLIGVDEAKAVLNVLGLLASVWIAFRNRRFVDKREFAKITIFMLGGMGAGVLLFRAAPLENLLFFYGLVIIAIALKNLFMKREIRVPRGTLTLVILLAGVIHGMFISGGALLVVYAAGRFKDKSAFRATLSSVWIVLNTLLFADHWNQGFFNREVLLMTALSILPLVGGIALGNRLHGSIRQSTFLTMTYILLLVSGLLLVR